MGDAIEKKYPHCRNITGDIGDTLKEFEPRPFVSSSHFLSNECACDIIERVPGRADDSYGIGIARTHWRSCGMAPMSSTTSLIARILGIPESDCRRVTLPGDRIKEAKWTRLLKDR